MRIISWHKFFSTGWILLVSGLLASCVKIADSGWDPQSYTVKTGDTLYSIAWRYEKDFREVASWNNISSSYNIYPGQRISLVPANSSGTMDDQNKPVIDASDEPFDVPAVIVGAVEYEPDIQPEPLKAEIAETVQRPESIVVRKGDTLYSIARYQNLNHKQLARWNFLSSPYAIYPGKTLRLRPPATSHANPPRNNRQIAAGSVKKPVTVSRAKAPGVAKAAPALPKKVHAWQWPAKGKLVKTFNARDTARKGIGIAGNRGQPVKAAAAGRVVYSGNGLIHYGNLIIIKHSTSFLSAYAHNRTLLVKEGDQVSAGQSIAQMGTVENGRARLHFEIRKGGKPVNPLIYLPSKRG